MKKFITLALSVMLLFCTLVGFAGCAKDDHESTLVWKSDATCHWLECDHCDLKVDVNKQLYSQQAFIDNIREKGLYIPVHWNNPEEYAKNIGVYLQTEGDADHPVFASFEEYVAYYNQGKAPHVYGKDGKCVCGATK